jgi:hypothetical protein
VVGDGRVAQRIVGVGLPEIEVCVETDEHVGVDRADARDGDGVFAADGQRHCTLRAHVFERPAEEVQILARVVGRPDVAVIGYVEVRELLVGVVIVVVEGLGEVADAPRAEPGPGLKRRRGVEWCADDDVCGIPGSVSDRGFAGIRSSGVIPVGPRAGKH